MATNIISPTPTQNDPKDQTELRKSLSDLTQGVNNQFNSLSSTSTWQLYPAGTYNFPSGPQTLPAGTLPMGAVTTAPTWGTGGTQFAKWRDNGKSIDVLFKGSQTAIGTNGSGFYLISLPPGKLLDTSLIGSYIGALYGNAGLAPSDGLMIQCLGYSATSLFFNIMVTSTAGAAIYTTWDSAHYNLGAFSLMNLGGILCGIPIQ
jgi:hypothetical protein